MKIESHEITVRELADGFSDNDEEWVAVRGILRLFSGWHGSRRRMPHISSG